MPAAGLGLSQAADIQIELAASGLSHPVAIANAGDSRLFIPERAGRIRILTFDAQGQATVLPTPFLDISSFVLAAGDPVDTGAVGGAEQGLLGIAFHPAYPSNGFFYVNYTCESSAQAAGQVDGDTIITRYSVTADPNIADPGSAVVLASIAQGSDSHNGGQLEFEPFPVPEDNRTLLYIGMGDGGSNVDNDPHNRAQNVNSLLGKILRVDVDNIDPTSSLPRYHIPNDNPFGTEIWTLGLRNPWRFSFDRHSGDMFIGDVGQRAREEVDFQPADSTGGENYGWRMCEGTARNIDSEAPSSCADGSGGLTPPILDYEHDEENCSVIGGYVYRGSEFELQLGGIYFYGDYCSQRVWGARKQADGNWVNIIDQVAELVDFAPLCLRCDGITSFGEDQNGELYFAVLGGGIYRIKADTSAPPTTPMISAGGVVDAAQFRAVVAPGGIGSIYGAKLADDTATAENLPLPFELGGARVEVDGWEAPLFFVSPNQINFQVPFEAGSPGEVGVVVIRNGEESPPEPTTIAEFAPAVFINPNSGEPIIQRHPDEALISAANPAKPGDVLIIFVTGVGGVSNPPATGAATADSPLARARVTPVVTVGGEAAKVLFAGLTPGFAGLGQINIQLPESLATTGPTMPLVIDFEGSRNPPVNLPVLFEP